MLSCHHQTLLKSGSLHLWVSKTPFSLLCSQQVWSPVVQVATFAEKEDQSWTLSMYHFPLWDKKIGKEVSVKCPQIVTFSLGLWFKSIFLAVLSHRPGNHAYSNAPRPAR